MTSTDLEQFIKDRQLGRPIFSHSCSGVMSDPKKKGREDPGNNRVIISHHIWGHENTMDGVALLIMNDILSYFSIRKNQLLY